MMMMIAPYQPRYHAQVVGLILGIQQGEFGVPVTYEDQPDLHDIPGFYQKADGNFWVAVQGEQVVGTVGLLSMGGNQVALRKMFVAKELRGAGVAEGLLDTVRAWCVQHDIRDIFLGTRDQLGAALRFYLKNGFVEVPVEKLPATFPRMHVDNVFYHRALPHGATL